MLDSTGISEPPSTFAKASADRHVGCYAFQGGLLIFGGGQAKVAALVRVHYKINIVAYTKNFGIQRFGRIYSLPID